jgi:prepilin-type processing-associated H-X9-DG protein
LGTTNIAYADGRSVNGSGGSLNWYVPVNFLYTVP